MKTVLAAQLHGKLNRVEEELEDLLTSNVFGSFEYIPTEDGLVPLLINTIKQDLNSCPFKEIGRIFDVKYEFWKTLHVPTCFACEPDVMINFTDENKNKIIVLVEAKYRSGKSSEADLDEEKPYDQLAREWDNLVHIAKEDNAKPYLLYITADISFPFKDFEASQSDYRRTRGQENALDIVWISWRKLPTIFQNTKHKIIKDLIEILKKQGLIFFEGFKIRPIEHINWKFTSTIKKLPIVEEKYNWSFKTQPILWKYEKNIKETEYNWSIRKDIGMNWRFEK